MHTSWPNYGVYDMVSSSSLSFVVQYRKSLKIPTKIESFQQETLI